MNVIKQILTAGLVVGMIGAPLGFALAQNAPGSDANSNQPYGSLKSPPPLNEGEKTQAVPEANKGVVSSRSVGVQRTQDGNGATPAQNSGQ